MTLSLFPCCSFMEQCTCEGNEEVVDLCVEVVVEDVVVLMKAGIYTSLTALYFYFSRSKTFLS